LAAVRLTPSAVWMSAVAPLLGAMLAGVMLAALADIGQRRRMPGNALEQAVPTAFVE